MKVLHLLSNWKWTERSEPAVDLVLAQQELGLDVVLACHHAPRPGMRDVAEMARQKGVSHVHAIDLPKHTNILLAGGQSRRLKRLIQDVAPDVIHCHMPNAHLLAACARDSRTGPILVTSCYEPDGPEPGLRTSLLYRRATDGVVVLNQRSAKRVQEKYGIPESAICIAEPGVDLKRFDPQRQLSGTDEEPLRAPSADIVVGIVSRVRAARRLDISIQALAQLRDVLPGLYLMIVGRGRGNAIEEVVLRPARELRVEDRLILSGYCVDDQLVRAYRQMDVLVYAMPGTDKSCRTVREAMAAGCPVIAPAIGFLPDLISDGTTGRLIDQNADALTAAIRELSSDVKRLARMGQAARAEAERRFDPSLCATRVKEFYATRLDACRGNRS